TSAAQEQAPAQAAREDAASPTRIDDQATRPGDAVAQQDIDQPDVDDLYADDGYPLIEDLTGVSELFRAHHWSLMEEQPVEVGGVYAEHWRRHDVSIAVHRTPEDRGLTAVFLR